MFKISISTTVERDNIGVIDTRHDDWRRGDKDDWVRGVGVGKGLTAG